MVNKLESALHWARKGWHVFPLVPGGKDPLRHPDAAPHGFNSGSRSGVQIRNWWTQYPDANIGGTGFIVVDVDDGQAAFDDWCAEIGFLPATRIHRTPSGGRHYIFAAPEDLKYGQPDLAKGVNIRAPGAGYVALPGSVVNGRGYEVEVDREPAEAPPELVEHCTRGRRARDPGEVGDVEIAPGVTLDQDQHVAEVIHYLKHEAPLGTPGHDVNETTRKVAYRCGNLGVSQGVCLDLMRYHYVNRYRAAGIPFVVNELPQIVFNGYRYHSETKLGSIAASDSFVAVTKAAQEHVENTLPPDPFAPPPLEQNRFRLAMHQGDEIDDIEEVPFAIEGMFPMVAVSILHGDKGTLKTSSAIDRALRRCYGLPWAGVDTVPGNCVFFAGEAPDVTRMAHKAWQTKWGFVEEDGKRRKIKAQSQFTLVTKVPCISSQADFRELVAFLQWLPDKPEDITLDHMFRMIDGNPSDLDTMRPLLERLELLRDEFKALVVMIAHNARGQENVYGSVASESYVDVVWHAKRAGTHAPLKLLNTKQKAVGEWEGALTFNRLEVDMGEGKRPGMVLEFNPMSAIKLADQTVAEAEARAALVIELFNTKLRNDPCVSTSTLAEEVAKHRGGEVPVSSIKKWLRRAGAEAGPGAKGRRADVAQYVFDRNCSEGWLWRHPSFANPKVEDIF